MIKTIFTLAVRYQYLDTNTLIDFFFARNGEENILAIRTIWERVIEKMYSAVVPFQSVTTLCYIMDKYKVPHTDAVRYISHITDICTIYGGDNNTIMAGLVHQSDDIEDRFIYQCAIETSCTALLTNNIKDFTTTSVNQDDQMTQIAIHTPYTFIHT